MKHSNYFSPNQIAVRYIKDNLIQRAFHHISKIQFEGNDAYVEAVSEVFKMNEIEDLITEWNITFDESLWTPSDKTSPRNIIEIGFLVRGSNNFNFLKLDLRKQIDEYKNL